MTGKRKGVVRGLAGGAVIGAAWAMLGGGALAQQSDAEKCMAWGAAPGTQAFFTCMATLDAQRSGAGMPSPQMQPQKRENIADGLATQMCIARARQSSMYPIERLATQNVSGSDPKSVSLSFKIIKPGTATAFWNITCVFREGRMVDFKS
ncbi:hypothetical protein ACLBXM_18105 [Xanthobacteraceae bacterium A53D]